MRKKVKVLVIQLCSTLFDPMDCTLPVFSVPGIFPGKNIGVEIAISFSRGSSRPRDQTQVSHIAGRLSTVWAIRKGLATK